MKTKKIKSLTWPIINYLGIRKERRKFTKPPIILGGCARSGTTLTLAILGAHPAIFTIPKEIRVFTNWIQVRNNGDVKLKPKRLDRVYRHLLTHRVPKRCKRWCEKDTINIWYLDQILDYFDNQVKFIHIIRDGRDVMTSRHPKAPEKFWVEPERWIKDMRIASKFLQHPSIYTVKYEDLILDFKFTVTKLMDFVGEEFHDNLYEWDKHTTIKRSQGWFTSVKKIHNKSIGRWKNPKFKARIDYIMKNQEVQNILREFQYL